MQSHVSLEEGGTWRFYDTYTHRRKGNVTQKKKLEVATAKECLSHQNLGRELGRKPFSARASEGCHPAHTLIFAPVT